MKTVINEIEKHIRTLCLPGSRPLGTKAHRQAGKYIRRVFENSGFLVESQEFESKKWQFHSAELMILNDSIRCIPNTFTPPCQIAAPLAILRNIEELRVSNLEGKIAVLSGDLAVAPYFPKNFTFYQDPGQQLIIRLLEEKSPEGIIAVCPQKGKLYPFFEDWDFKIPSLTIPIEEWNIIRQYSGIATIEINSVLKPAKSFNIISRKKGKGPGKLILCAHYDTKFWTPGAGDNAAGTSVLLVLASALKKVSLNFDLEFVAFASEEYSGKGEEVYLESIKDDAASVKMAINIDGIGQKGIKDTICFLGCSDEQKAKIISGILKYRHLIESEPWYESDHSIFWQKGIPAMALSCDGLIKSVNTIFHTENDTPDRLDMEQIANTVIWLEELIINV